MKKVNSSLLKQKAKRAYEWSRFVAASKWLLAVFPLVCLGLYASHSPTLALLCGFSLALLVVGSKWRGQEFGSGVLPGLLAGAIAFGIPFTLHILEICCRYDIERASCAISGAIGGFVLGRMIGKSKREHRLISLGVGIAIAVMIALMSCLSFEVGALAGLFVALIISGISVFFIQAKTLRKT